MDHENFRAQSSACVPFNWNILMLFDLHENVPMNKINVWIQRFGQNYFIIVFKGGRLEDGTHSDAILRYYEGSDEGSDKWLNVGSMTVGRADHSVALLADTSKICPRTELCCLLTVSSEDLSCSPPPPPPTPPPTRMTRAQLMEDPGSRGAGP